MSFPFGIVLPEPELRSGEWARHRDRGTVWLPVEKGRGIEVGVFLIRSETDQSFSLEAAGWSTTLVNTRLADGHYLVVVAGDSMAHVEKQRELAEVRARAKGMLGATLAELANPRLLLTACDAKQTRRFIEVSLRPER